MKSRPIAASFFVVFCLLLCGLILRRQIAAHPMPPESGKHMMGEQRNFWMDLQDAHAATPAIAAQARETVQGQLTALHEGNGLKAMSYQSQFMRQMFVNPKQFVQMIVTQYPEFGRCRQAHFGPVWMDKSQQHAQVVVMILGENGHRARGEYMLSREGNEYKISGVRTQRLPD